MRAYEYTMQYRPGKEHMNADCFSRLPLPVTEAADPEDRVLMIEELEDCSVLSGEKISEWTSRDPVLARVHEYLLRGWRWDDKRPDLAAYRVWKDELSVQDGCVLWGARVVIPQQGRQQVMSELHAAHPGIKRVKGLARSYVWWPGMDSDLQNLVRVKNTSMCLLLHRYIYGSFQMVRGSEFMWTMLAHSKEKCFWWSSMPFPNSLKLPS